MTSFFSQGDVDLSGFDFDQFGQQLQDWVNARRAKTGDERLNGGQTTSDAPEDGTDTADSPTTADTQQTPEQASALVYLTQKLEEWGISSLSNDVLSMIQQGYTTDSITLRLRDTDAYKQRFAGNIKRLQAGLPVLSEADYIGVENQYRNVMQTYGLPPGFYDQPEDFAGFIGNDMSPAEMQARVQTASETYLYADQFHKDAWAQYGFTQGDAIASILDESVALPLIQQRATAVGIGAAANRQGLTDPGATRALDLAQLGVTEDQAVKGYAQIADSLGTQQQVGQRFGVHVTQTDAEDAALLGDAAANRKLQRLSTNEESLFRQGAGASSASLSRRTNY